MCHQQNQQVIIKYKLSQRQKTCYTHTTCSTYVSISLVRFQVTVFVVSLFFPLFLAVLCYLLSVLTLYRCLILCARDTFQNIALTSHPAHTLTHRENLSKQLKNTNKIWTVVKIQFDKPNYLPKWNVFKVCVYVPNRSIQWNESNNAWISDREEKKRWNAGIESAEWKKYEKNIIYCFFLCVHQEIDKRQNMHIELIRVFFIA